MPHPRRVGAAIAALREERSGVEGGRVIIGDRPAASNTGSRSASPTATRVRSASGSVVRRADCGRMALDINAVYASQGLSPRLPPTVTRHDRDRPWHLWWVSETAVLVV